jgi:hypothetical protein
MPNLQVRGMIGAALAGRRPHGGSSRTTADAWAPGACDSLGVRSIFVFPDIEQAAVVALLDELSPGQRYPWLVDGCLFVWLTTEDEYLYLDWEPQGRRFFDFRTYYERTKLPH